MSFDIVWAELKNIYRVRSNQQPYFASHLNETDVQRWNHSTHISRADLYDQVAVHLAHGFHNSELDFTFCDAVLNDIHEVITHAQEERPSIFWKVYLAFDEGEYYHNNNRDENPIEIYTRPQIAQIVKDYKL